MISYTKLRLLRQKCCALSLLSSSISSTAKLPKSEQRMTDYQKCMQTKMTTKAKAETQRNFLLDVNPDDAKLLFNMTTFQSKKSKTKLSLFDHISRYSTQYKEKYLLVDPRVARKIANAILERTTSKDSTFIDADGGLCLVTRELDKLQTGQFRRPYRIFERDGKLLDLTKTVLADIDNKIDFLSLNYIRVSDNDVHHLCEGTLDLTDRDWQDEVPRYSLVGTATHGTIKSLTQQCLRTWDKVTFKSNLPMTGVFDNCRPEFFFIVSSKTKHHLTVTREEDPKGHRLRHSNILFQILFDYDVCLELPLESFFPWKMTRWSVKEFNEPLMYLIRVRPKADVGLGVGDDLDSFRSHHLQHFLAVIYQKKSERFIPLIEQCVPGSGFDCIKKAGATMYLRTGDILPAEAVKYFNVLRSQKFYNLSSFVTSADLDLKSREEEIARTSKMSKMLDGEDRVEMRKRIALGQKVNLKT